MGTDGKQRFEVTHRLVLSIAVPMTIGHLTTPIFGLVDTAVIGQLGIAALLGGLAIGTILVDMMFFTFNFLRSGTVGLTAQAFGAGDKIEIQATLFRALGLAVVIGLLLLLATPWLLEIGLWFMEPGEAAARATREYFNIRMISAPIALANYVLFGWFLGQGQAKMALLLQLLMNGLNIVFSVILGLWMSWGIAGVATASVVAEALGCFVGLVLAWRSLEHEFTPDWIRITNISAIKRLMSLNGDILIRSSALLFAFAYFTAQGTKFGDTILAANAVLFHFFFFSGYFLDGLAVAAEQICGRAIGARDRSAFIRSVKLTIGWSIALAFILAGVFYAIGEPAIDLVTKSEEVRIEARNYYLWAALVGLAGVIAFVMDGIYIGSTWSREMSVTMIISLIGYIAIWNLVDTKMGNDGLWLSLYAFLILRGLTMSIRLPRNIGKTFA